MSSVCFNSGWTNREHVSDLFLVGYDGVGRTVKYSQNGIVLHTTTGVPAGLKTWMHGCFRSVGAKVRNLQSGPLPEMRFPAKCSVAGPMLLLANNDPPGRYLDDPFGYPKSWDERMTEAVYRMLRSAGFDGIRLQVNPGPWLEAKANGDDARLDYLDSHLDQAVYGATARGFGVMLAIFYTGFLGLTAQSALQGLGTEGWENHKWLMARWANRYKTVSPERFAPETFNEPPLPSSFPADWANDLQPDLYLLLRDIMPDHTIVLTPDRWSDKWRLTEWDLSDKPYNVNTIIDIHPFLPSVFAQQGYIYTQYKHLGPLHRRLQFPPNPAQRALVEADYIERATAAGESPETIANVLQDLAYYFELPQDELWLETIFDDVAAWCAAQGIAPARIIVGEWGIVRDNGGFPLTDPPIPGSQGADLYSAMRYLAAYKAALIRFGCRWALIHLDTLDYGITDALDHFIGKIRPELLLAIQPHHHILKWKVAA